LIVAVSSVPHQEGLALDIGLVLEEGIVHGVAPLVYLRCMNLEAERHLEPAPSPATLYLCLLVQQRVALCIQIVEIHRAVPVHIPVTRIRLSQTGSAVHALYKDTQFVAIEVVGV